MRGSGPDGLRAGPSAGWPAGLAARCLTAGLRRLDRLPASVAERVLAALALVQSVGDPGRVRRALAWAAHHREGRRKQWALVLALLANRGRLLAVARRLDAYDAAGGRPEALAMHGLEHLEVARRRGGVILLAFHVGAGSPARPLTAHGYSVTSSGAGDGLAPPRKTILRTGGRRRSVQWRTVRERASGLYELRRRLLQGELVIMAAEAPEGREAFRIALPGADLTVRSGWLVLRHLTRAATLPVLTHVEGRRRCVTIHPALPAPAADLAEDTAACQAALTPVLEEFVRRFPEQCPALALGPRRPAARPERAGSSPASGRPAPSGPVFP